jgi:hypothetical protein
VLRSPWFAGVHGGANEQNEGRFSRSTARTAIRLDFIGPGTEVKAAPGQLQKSMDSGTLPRPPGQIHQVMGMASQPQRAQTRLLAGVEASIDCSCCPCKGRLLHTISCIFFQKSSSRTDRRLATNETLAKRDPELPFIDANSARAKCHLRTPEEPLGDSRRTRPCTVYLRLPLFRSLVRCGPSFSTPWIPWQ